MSRENRKIFELYAIVESPYENDNNNIEEKNIEKALDEELIMKLS